MDLGEVLGTLEEVLGHARRGAWGKRCFWAGATLDCLILVVFCRRPLQEVPVFPEGVLGI